MSARKMMFRAKALKNKILDRSIGELIIRIRYGSRKPFSGQGGPVYESDEAAAAGVVMCR
jgi:hypothetical protein